MNKSIKFWLKNEKEVIKKLGLKPTPQSGAGELLKEDGHNEHIICQLKSTNKNQITIKKLDIEKLQYHADVDKKIPIFVIQFLDGPLLIATTPTELGNISKYLDLGLFDKTEVKIYEAAPQREIKVIKSANATFEEVRGKIKDG